MPATKSRPNLLYIHSDQHAPSVVGCYGEPLVQTPNLERLACEGVRFNAAYTAFPLCAPGRACLMTGRHASEIGAWDNGALLSADQATFAHYLTDAGYDTVLSGKMHFVGPDQLHGFRRRLTTDIYSSDFNWTLSRIRIGGTTIPISSAHRRRTVPTRAGRSPPRSSSTSGMKKRGFSLRRMASTAEVYPGSEA